MKITRSDQALKLPGGERKWRRMARLAGFDGTVRVRPFRKSDEHGRRITMGTLSPNGRTITVHINHGPGRATFKSPSSYNPLSTFGHELGHFILKQRGRSEWTTRARAWRDNAEQRSDPVERAADRYSRLLRTKASRDK